VHLALQSLLVKGSRVITTREYRFCGCMSMGIGRVDQHLSFRLIGRTSSVQILTTMRHAAPDRAATERCPRNHGAQYGVQSQDISDAPRTKKRLLFAILP
jgi:hypothetical protein